MISDPGILGTVETGTHPSAGVFAAADVHYLATGGARAAAIAAADAAFSRPAAGRTALVPHAGPCQPGQFRRRELPPPRAALDGPDQMAPLITDGNAGLDPDGRPGPGAREESGVPAIGVARSAFHGATRAVAVPRGTSARPLYVTADGMPAPPPPTSSSTWPASTGHPTPCAAPAPSPATAGPSRRLDTPCL